VYTDIQNQVEIVYTNLTGYYRRSLRSIF
jgi:hypothetical protein